MSTPRRSRVGQVYRCPVCGAEVSIIAGGGGALAPRCCNQAMRSMPQAHATYRCPVCGAEVMVLRQRAGHLAPVCCNTPMRLRRLAA